MRLRLTRCHTCVWLVCVLVLVQVEPVATKECTLPNKDDIRNSTQELLNSQEGENSFTIDLITHHFTCLAVEGYNLYSELSVAVKYRNGTETDNRTAQFQMRCIRSISGDILITEGFEQNIPESVFTTATRKDCYVCTNTISVPYDQDTNCIECSETCQNLGMGSCRNNQPTSCCPFFDTDGSCSNTTQHICNASNPCDNGGTCNMTGPFVTNYTCSCIPPYTGVNCEVCNSSYQCIPGHYLNTTNCSCNSLHKCMLEDHPCQNGGTCGVMEGSGDVDYFCTCPQNFTGVNCETCDYYCPPGYNSSANCSTCVPIHVCFLIFPCENGGNCSMGPSLTEYSCICPDGFNGSTCEDETGSGSGSGSGLPFFNPDDIPTSLSSSAAINSQPSLPVLQPSTPALQPSSPALQPSSPALQPSSPALQPSSPALQPSSPALQPSSSTVPLITITPTPVPEVLLLWPWFITVSVLGPIMVFTICLWTLICCGYVLKRRRKDKQKSQDQEKAPLWMSEELPEPGTELARLHPPPMKRAFSQSATIPSQTIRILESLSRPILAEDIGKDAVNEPKLHAEFSGILSNMVTMNEVPTGAEEKNRYRDVLPNTHSRVLLFLKFGVPHSDYINANYIRGYNGQLKAFIATQGPLSLTVNDFWRMVWDQKTSVIIMVTSLEEKGKTKCCQYWPDPTSKSLTEVRGELEITTRTRTSTKNHTITTLLLRHRQRHVTREVVHYWFTAWPDHGVPEHTEPFIDFILETRKAIKNCDIPGPVIVHCSSGISRTGVFIGADIGMRELEEKNRVDVLKIVSSMRQDRGGMVQTKDQYVFLHKILYDYAAQLGRVNLDSALGFENPTYTPAELVEEAGVEECGESQESRRDEHEDESQM